MTTKKLPCREDDGIVREIALMKFKGRTLQSGEIEYEGKLYTYKIRELKKKPRKFEQCNNMTTIFDENITHQCQLEFGHKGDHRKGRLTWEDTPITVRGERQ